MGALMWAEGWQRNLAALWLGQMLSIAGFSFFMPLIPLFVQSLGGYEAAEAVRWAGAMSAISSLAMALAQPYWGSMADRWGRKPMVLRSMVGSGATTILMGFATTPEVMTALYTLQGLITGTVAASTALIAATVPKQQMGFALGMLQVSIFVGASCGPLGGGILADAFGFQVAFFAAGILLILGAGVVALLVREEFTPPPATARGKSTWAESRSVLGIALIPLLIGIIFLIQFGNTTMSPVIALFVAGLAGGENPATTVGLVMGSAGVASATSAFLLGRVGDRKGHAPILMVCLAGAALSYFPQAAVNQVWQLLLLRMLMGAFLGGLMPSANALVAEMVPRNRRGAAFGLTASASGLSHAVGPLFGAGIASLWGLRGPFLASGCVYVLAFIWAGTSLRRRPSPEGPATTVASGEAPTPPLPMAESARTGKEGGDEG